MRSCWFRGCRGQPQPGWFDMFELQFDSDLPTLWRSGIHCKMKIRNWEEDSGMDEKERRGGGNHGI